MTDIGRVHLLWLVPVVRLIDVCCVEKGQSTVVQLLLLELRSKILWPVSSLAKLKILIENFLSLFLRLFLLTSDQVNDSHFRARQWQTLIELHFHIAASLQVLQLDSTVQVGKDEAPFSPLGQLFILNSFFGDFIASDSDSHLEKLASKLYL